MRISGPETYRLRFDPESFSVECAKNTPRFSGLATSPLPKLYIVSFERKPVYVGVTKRSMRERLWGGWNADGANGYRGYAWRHHLTEADLDIWSHDNAGDDRSILDIETVETEVVFLIRQAGQWPAFQTEIHFHMSTPIHREVAANIFGHFSVRDQLHR